MPGAPRWWRREADEALLPAREAKGRAAITLLQLDAVQRDVEREVEAYARCGFADGPPLASTWAALRDEAFAATTAYLEVAQGFDVEADLSADVARAAGQQFARVGAVMGEVVRRVSAFSEEAEPHFSRVHVAVAQQATRRRAFETADAAARAAVAAARSAGLLTVDADSELAAAGVAAAQAREGDSEHEATATAVATGHAEAARELALGLPARREEVTRRLSSTRTRLQITEDRVQRLPATLSELRKRYAAEATEELGELTVDVTGALDRAHEQLARAAQLARDDTQRWGAAETSLQAARAACTEAEAGATLAQRRLCDLDAVAEDPQPLLVATRRTVRDAQRFTLDQAPPLDIGLAAVLDALAERLDAVQSAAAGGVPGGRVDHWAYLRELTDVAERATAVVLELRDRRGKLEKG